ncbi:PREDICTED: trichome birefringence [Prunus dulcis]|uniref:PREDICTED: trichome birefringence n=1 Tax=Prunus dulcis TaxID=3755 RepID=A0A5E4E6E6_PRUDU|nr:protein trichome birefringence-like 18 [Prunus dulcis]VVA10982.1 PREDICTED: trichome birefringence [Prunus dulcis]
MTWASPKASISMTHYPKALSWIVVSVVGLALFLLFASWVLVTYPIGSTVSWYFYGVDSLQKLDYSSSIGSQTSYDSPLPNNVDNFNKNVKSESNIEVPESSDGAHTKVVDKDFPSDSNSQVPTSSDGSVVVSETKDIKDLAALQANLPGPSVIENVASVESAGPSVPAGSTGSSIDDNMKITDKNLSYESNPQLSSSSGSSNVTEIDETGKPVSVGLFNNSNFLQIEPNDSVSDPSDSKSGSMPASSPLPSNARTGGSVDSGCDLYSGSWIYDSSGPLYTNNTCPVLTQMQNCQGNGRPDKEYENWRWKPLQCDLPRFDARKFLELMRGKTIAFIGDSVARNHMESLLCILWQVDVPKNRGNKRMQRFFFKSTSTFVVRIWSSWLVKQTSEAFDFAPEGVAKLHLDAPDDRFMDLIPQFDVIIFSSGHWFAKQSVYVLNNEIVGGQLWWPDKSRPMKINNIDAFGISVETILRAVATHPNYTGIAIVRSYSPDHYEGGAWNTGGSCTGKVRPLAIGEVVENGFTNIMHQKQIMGFNRAIEKGVTNKSKLKLMDITKPFEYRHDGHPGPYRSPDPNKKTQRGPDGRPPPQDCLHWCMPGPVDTWNEFVLEIIRREYEGSNNSST